MIFSQRDHNKLRGGSHRGSTPRHERQHLRHHQWWPHLLWRELRRQHYHSHTTSYGERRIRHRPGHQRGRSGLHVALHHRQLPYRLHRGTGQRQQPTERRWKLLSGRRALRTGLWTVQFRSQRRKLPTGPDHRHTHRLRGSFVFHRRRRLRLYRLTPNRRGYHYWYGRSFT